MHRLRHIGREGSADWLIARIYPSGKYISLRLPFCRIRIAWGRVYNRTLQVKR